MDLQIERLKRKLCLVFPVEAEPTINLVKKEEDGILKYKASIDLLGSTLEDVEWWDSKSRALKKILILANRFIDKMYRLVLFKFRVDGSKKKKEVVVPAVKKPEVIKTKRINKAQVQTVQQTRKPTFVEDKKETKNNIIYSLTTDVRNPGDFIEQYCKGKTIAFPEYLFEKSNGVFLCRATFLNERFESRYAYEMETAKKDVANLIVSYIRHKILETKDVEYEKLLSKFLKNEDSPKKGTDDVQRESTKRVKNETTKKSGSTFKMKFKPTTKQSESFSIPRNFDLDTSTLKMKSMSKQSESFSIPRNFDLDPVEQSKSLHEANETLLDEIPMLCTEFEKEVNPNEIQDIVNCLKSIHGEEEEFDFLAFNDL